MHYLSLTVAICCYFRNGFAQPENKKTPGTEIHRAFAEALAEWTGLEPATPDVTGRYSNQLNYHSAEHFNFQSNRGGVDGTRTRDPRRDRPVF